MVVSISCAVEEYSRPLECLTVFWVIKSFMSAVKARAGAFMNPGS